VWKKAFVVVFIVVFALAVLQLSLNPPQVEALKGAGINRLVVTGGVVVLAVLLGYYLWANSQRQKL
jgi:hypothetical protein